MPSTDKVQFVDSLSEDLKSSDKVLIADYQGLKAEDFQELRTKLKGQGVKFKVIKNRLAKRAFNQVGWDGLDEYLKGPSAIAYKGQDTATLVKTLFDFKKKNEKFKIRAGRLFGKVADEAELKTIASLPSKEVLLATLLSRLLSPLQTLTATLNEPIRSLHAVLSSVAKKKESAPTA